MYIYMHTYTYVYVYVYIRTHTQCMHTNARAAKVEGSPDEGCIHANVHIYTWELIHTCIYLCILIHSVYIPMSVPQAWPQ